MSRPLCPCCGNVLRDNIDNLFLYCQKCRPLFSKNKVQALVDNECAGKTPSPETPAGLDDLLIFDGYRVDAYWGDASHVSIPDGIVSVATFAFAGSHIESVSFPNSLKKLRHGAFYRCRNLRSIRIPEGVETIPEYCFTGCTSLEEIILPETVKTISSNAFRGCSSIRRIITPCSCQSVLFSHQFEGTAPEGSILIHIDGSEFMDDFLIRNGVLLRCNSAAPVVKIPNNVHTVGPYAFYGSPAREVIIPESVTSLSNHAFESSGLQTLYLPDTVSSVGTHAFAHCIDLEKASLSNNNMTSIPPHMFTGCIALREVELSNKLQTIEYRAFSHCKSLDTIAFPPSLRSIGDAAFFLSGFHGCCLSIPGTVKQIGNWAFAFSDIKEVVLEDGVRTIGDLAFTRCNKLEKLTFTESVTSIGRSIISFCDLNMKIDCPEHINRIETLF